MSSLNYQRLSGVNQGAANAGPLALPLILQNSAGVAQSIFDAYGNLVPSAIDPGAFYTYFDWDTSNAGTGYSANGNTVNGACNSVSAPLMLNSTQSVAYVNTISTTSGGYLATGGAYAMVKQAAITYQWRHIFYVPTASSSTNRYSAFAGSSSYTGTANNSNSGPFAGPYVKYRDNVNSGNWVMGNSVAGTLTEANSSVAVVGNKWYTLVITMNNAVFSYSIAQVGSTLAALGTVTDTNVTTTPSNNCFSVMGGIMIIPDGTNYTTQSNLMIDRSDYYVTGLTR